MIHTSTVAASKSNVNEKTIRSRRHVQGFPPEASQQIYSRLAEHFFLGKPKTSACVIDSDAAVAVCSQNINYTVSLRNTFDIHYFAATFIKGLPSSAIGNRTPTTYLTQQKWQHRQQRNGEC